MISITVIPKFIKASNVRHVLGGKPTLQQAFRILHKLWEPCLVSELHESQASCLNLMP